MRMYIEDIDDIGNVQTVSVSPSDTGIEIRIGKDSVKISIGATRSLADMLISCVYRSGELYEFIQSVEALASRETLK